MRRRTVTVLFVVAFILWNAVTYIFLVGKSDGKRKGADVDIRTGGLQERLAELREQVQRQKQEQQHLDRLVSQLMAEIERERAAKREEADQQQRHKPQFNIVDVIEKPPEPLDKPAAVPSVSKDVEPAVVLQVPGNQRKEPVNRTSDDKYKMAADDVILPVLVIACNRVSVKQNLDQLLKYRPSAERFPIIVSQDCGDQATANMIRSYGDQLTHIEHIDMSDIVLPPKEKIFKEYFLIARHYKWALNQIFHTFNFDAVIIVEDDLNIAPDFFEYFSATFNILHQDPSLWCVSAWNDNGKSDMVSDEAELLYRTDFFPGLGWLMEKSTWLELEEKWPDAFWDDWMRHPDQRKERSCIRPEVSRTTTFGKIGASKGQFFEKYLKFMRLNENLVPFTQRNLTYLFKDNYDSVFVRKVYDAPLQTVAQVLSNTQTPNRVARVQYEDAKQFKIYAKQLGLMEDLKSGVPRAGYRGVVSFFRAGQRIYFAPPASWTKYDPSWT